MQGSSSLSLNHYWLERVGLSMATVGYPSTSVEFFRGSGKWREPFYLQNLYLFLDENQTNVCAQLVALRLMRYPPRTYVKGIWGHYAVGFDHLIRPAMGIIRVSLPFAQSWKCIMKRLSISGPIPLEYRTSAGLLQTVKCSSFRKSTQVTSETGKICYSLLWSHQVVNLKTSKIFTKIGKDLCKLL